MYRFVSAGTIEETMYQRQIYKQVQAIMHEEQPNVFTVYPDEIQALSASVERFPEAGYRDALGWAHLIAKR